MKNHVVLYRAMYQEEADKTLSDQCPYFTTHYKFFSTDLKFIINRVQRPNFAHSEYNGDSYFTALRFL